MAETIVALLMTAGIFFIVRSFKVSRNEAYEAQRRLDADLAARELLERHKVQERRFGSRDEANTAEAAPFVDKEFVVPAPAD